MNHIVPLSSQLLSSLQQRHNMEGWDLFGEVRQRYHKIPLSYKGGMAIIGQIFTNW